MLSPKKTKYKKYHINQLKNITAKGHTIVFGTYALIAVSGGYLSSKQIESARVAINRKIKKTGKIWIRIFPDKPTTKKPAEIRMGKGKGSVNEWVSLINPGKILYEINGVDLNAAKKIMKLAQSKLPISTRFIYQ